MEHMATDLSGALPWCPSATSTVSYDGFMPGQLQCVWWTEDELCSCLLPFYYLIARTSHSAWLSSLLSLLLFFLSQAKSQVQSARQ